MRGRSTHRLVVASCFLVACTEPRHESSTSTAAGAATVPIDAAPAVLAPSPTLHDAEADASDAGDAGALDAGAQSSSERASACLEDPLCPASEADRLFRAADDAHEAEVDCLRFADGDGTAKDLVRSRACLDRAYAGTKCEGSSSDLGRAELAIDRIDGVGGPRDVAGARALFADCFDDVTKQGILDHAAAREADAGAPPMRFCEDYGGTTLTGNECSARARQREQTRGALTAKRVVASLDDDGKHLFVAASRAYAAYVSAVGDYVYEIYKDGTIRNAVALAEETELTARRTSEIAKVTRFAAKPVSEEEVDLSSKRVEAAVSRAAKAAASPDVAGKLAVSQAAWTVYRDAEVALYVHLATSAPPGMAKAATLVALNKARLADLKRH
jgi:uncharacterized protein YecT (DUF1311 family)